MINQFISLQFHVKNTCVIPLPREIMPLHCVRLYNKRKSDNGCRVDGFQHPLPNFFQLILQPVSLGRYGSVLLLSGAESHFLYSILKLRLGPGHSTVGSKILLPSSKRTESFPGPPREGKNILAVVRLAFICRPFHSDTRCNGLGKGASMAWMQSSSDSSCVKISLSISGADVQFLLQSIFKAGKASRYPSSKHFVRHCTNNGKNKMKIKEKRRITWISKIFLFQPINVDAKSVIGILFEHRIRKLDCSVILVPFDFLCEKFSKELEKGTLFV